MSAAVRPDLNGVDDEQKALKKQGSAWTTEDGNILPEVLERLHNRVHDGSFEMDMETPEIQYLVTLMQFGGMMPLKRNSPYWSMFNKCRLVMSCYMMIVTLATTHTLIHDALGLSEDYKDNLSFQMVCLSWFFSMSSIHMWFSLNVKTIEESILYKLFKTLPKTEDQYMYMKKITRRTAIGVTLIPYLGNTVVLIFAALYTLLPERMLVIVRSMDPQQRDPLSVAWILLVMFPFDAVWGISFAVLFIPPWIYVFRFRIIFAEIKEVKEKDLPFRALKQVLASFVEPYFDLCNSIQNYNIRCATLGVLALIGYGIPLLMLLIEMLSFNPHDALKLMELFWFMIQLSYTLLMFIPQSFLNSYVHSFCGTLTRILPSPFSMCASSLDDKMVLNIIKANIEARETPIRVANFAEVTTGLLVQVASAMFSILLLFRQTSTT